MFALCYVLFRIQNFPQFSIKTREFGDQVLKKLINSTSQQVAFSFIYQLLIDICCRIKFWSHNSMVNVQKVLSKTFEKISLHKHQKYRMEYTSSVSSYSLQLPTSELASNCDISYMEGQTCDVKLKIDNTFKDEVSFSWNLKNIKINESQFSKHLLIVDFGQNHSQGAFAETTSAYSRFMKLGDLIKVVDMRMMKETIWVEKTNKELNWSRTNLNSGVLQIAKKAIVKSEMYGEHLSLSFIFNGDLKTAADMYNPLAAFLKTGIYSTKINFFFPDRFIQTLWAGFPTFPHPPSKYCFTSFSTLLKDSFREYFREFVRLRARTVTIALKCLNAETSVKNHNSSSRWELEKNKVLVRRLTNLNNYSDYIEKIDISSMVDITKVDFQVKFRIELLSGLLFEMEQFFMVRLEGGSKRSRYPQNINKSKPESTHAESPEKSRNISMHSEQITLHEDLGLDV